jgi:hypothetical protein
MCICKCIIHLQSLWNDSSIFSDWPFFSMCTTFNVCSIVPYVCPVSSICWEYFDICLFVCLFYGLDMVFVSDFQYTSCLSGVFQWAFLSEHYNGLKCMDS